ncbi:MAG: acyltransferase, partial [Oxalobacteraceae bacterium]
MSETSQERLYGLDLARIILVMMVVMGHVGMTYISLPGWAVNDGFDSLVSIYVFVSQLAIMITFFMISGFAARAQIIAKGAGFFIQDRMIRIVAPLIVFGAIIYALMPLIWRLGDRAMSVTGTGVADGYNPVIDFPLSHLWFLYVLAIFYAISLPLMRVTGRLSPALDAALALSVRSWVTPL